MGAGRPLAPALLLASAYTIVGLVERHRWRWPDDVDAAIPRDLTLVQLAGYWSHFDERYGSSNWPLPEVTSVDELAQFAGTSRAIREAPLVGDLFLWWSGAKHKFIRTDRGGDRASRAGSRGA